VEKIALTSFLITLGGNSDEEIMSALFLYSKTPFNHKPQSPSERIVNQVDLAPTLSLLLNHPIPYGSLGMIIPELFETTNQSILNTSCSRFKTQQFDSESDQRTEQHSCLNFVSSDPLTSAYLMNSVQVMRHILHYFEGHILQSTDLSDLRTILKHLDLPHPCFPLLDSTVSHDVMIDRQEVRYLHALLKEAICFHTKMLQICPSFSDEEYSTSRAQLHEAYQRFLQESLHFARFDSLSPLPPSPQTAR
jgi:hypothetical protein